MKAKPKNVKLMLIWTALLTVILINPLFAEEVAPNSQEGEKPLTEVEIKMQQRISIAFDNEPIDRVLLALSDQADIDIVKSPEVSGSVTAVLTDIPVGEALDQILASQGYGYVASQNMIRVVPKKDLVNIQEPIISKVYRVTYADVKEVERALRKFISKEGSLSANPGTSNIIVTETESKIAAIDDFINEIDRVTPQVLVEVRIYDITSSDLLDLGVSWFISTNSGLGSALGTGPDGLQGTQTGKTEPFSRGILDSATNLNPEVSNSIRFGILNSSVNIDVLLSADQQEAHAELLANPRILVLDNEDAIFKSIREIPYQELTETSEGGRIGTTEFREVGVQLQVTPHVTRDEMVRLRVQPEFSIEVGTVDVADIEDDRFQQPIVDKREADTTLLVKDGQTVVLGGLRKKDALKKVNKVPLLGDMPLLGPLFSFTGEKIVVNELIVFITPHVVTKPVMTQHEANRYKETEIPPATRAESKIKEIKEKAEELKKEDKCKPVPPCETPGVRDCPAVTPNSTFKKS